MKRASWVLRATSSLALCASLLSCSSLEPETAPPGLIHVTSADVAKVSPGDLTGMPPQVLGPLPSLAWMPTALPYAPPRAVAPNPTGTDVAEMASTTTWFRITLPAAAVTDNLNALYLPRWHTWGNLAIYANGELVYNSQEDSSNAAFNRSATGTAAGGTDSTRRSRDRRAYGQRQRGGRRPLLHLAGISSAAPSHVRNAAPVAEPYAANHQFHFPGAGCLRAGILAAPATGRPRSCCFSCCPCCSTSVIFTTTSRVPFFPTNGLPG